MKFDKQLLARQAFAIPCGGSINRKAEPRCGKLFARRQKTRAPKSREKVGIRREPEDRWNIAAGFVEVNPERRALQEVFGTDRAHIAKRRMIATHHQVLAVIERIAGRGFVIGAGAAAGLAARFEEGEIAATALRKRHGRCKAAYAGADNRYF